MKRSLFVCAAIVAPLLLAGCGTGTPGSTPSSGGDFPEQTVPKFDTQIDNDLPPSDALNCDSRVVRTSEHEVALVNVAVVGNEHTYYFAPSSSAYDSYDLFVQFENGQFWVSAPSSGVHRALVAIGEERQEVPTALGSSLHTISFDVPADLAPRLGKVKFYTAAINGEHVGTCTVE